MDRTINVVAEGTQKRITGDVWKYWHRQVPVNVSVQRFWQGRMQSMQAVLILVPVHMQRTSQNKNFKKRLMRRTCMACVFISQ